MSDARRAEASSGWVCERLLLLENHRPEPGPIGPSLAVLISLDGAEPSRIGVGEL
jgi:hypothetical protein